MLLVVFIIAHLTVLSVANPFHKYPYVFLLDVGNEELEKTNTEQIRVSLPGGSLAIRYPAIGFGDTIGHMRVSGIDFGTDLKSSIIDGGPGYQYVVLVFMGNPGVPYDAIVTIQTVPEEKTSYNVQDNSIGDSSVDNSNSYQDEKNLERDITEDENNSAEESNDSNLSETQNSEQTHAEIVQPSSNVYNYAENEVNNEDSRANDDLNSKDIHKQYIENPSQIYSNQDVSVKDYADRDDEQNDYETDDGNDESDQKDYQSDDQNNDPRAEKYTIDQSKGDELDNQSEAVSFVDKNLYEKYKVLRPHLFSNVKVYPQDPQVRIEVPPEPHEDPVEIDQMFNDEEIHNDAVKYTDNNNNNNFDSDDSSAVAS